MPTPKYSSNRLSANVESLVAKFPDQDLFGFQCAITVCMRELGQCDGITVNLLYCIAFYQKTYKKVQAGK